MSHFGPVLIDLRTGTGPRNQGLGTPALNNFNGWNKQLIYNEDWFKIWNYFNISGKFTITLMRYLIDFIIRFLFFIIIISESQLLGGS